MGTSVQPRVLAIVGGSLLMSAVIMLAVAYVLREQQIVLIVLSCCAGLDLIVGSVLLLPGLRRMGESRPCSSSWRQAADSQLVTQWKSWDSAAASSSLSS